MAMKLEYALMQKGDEKIAVDKSLINDHELLGWNIVGTAEVDGDENVTETGKVINTPAHTIMDANGYLKVIPIQEDKPAPSPFPSDGSVIKVEFAKVIKVAKVGKPTPKVEPVAKVEEKVKK